MSTVLQTICRNCGVPSPLRPLLGAPPSIQECGTCAGWTLTGEKFEADLSQIYSEKYFSGEEYLSYEKGSSIQALNFRRKLKILGNAARSPEEWRLLEIGSATGEFLKCARDAGVRHSLGIEVSDYARSIAQKSGFDVVSPFGRETKDRIANFRPNILVAWDVWEHLENPVQVFTDVLKENGSLQTIAISTVDAGSFVPQRKRTKWRQFHPPSHLNYPTRQSFQRFFEGRGFEISYQNDFGYYRPLAEYVVALAPALRSFTLSQDWLFKIPLYLNLFDSQIVVAHRK